MQNNGKQCVICTYVDVCPRKRKNHKDIKDCCIPEAPLREIQQNALNTEQWILLSQNYVKQLKARSYYWTVQKHQIEVLDN